MSISKGNEVWACNKDEEQTVADVDRWKAEARRFVREALYSLSNQKVYEDPDIIDSVCDALGDYEKSSDLVPMLRRFSQERYDAEQAVEDERRMAETLLAAWASNPSVNGAEQAARYAVTCLQSFNSIYLRRPNTATVKLGRATMSMPQPVTIVMVIGGRESTFTGNWDELAPSRDRARLPLEMAEPGDVALAEVVGVPRTREFKVTRWWVAPGDGEK